MHRKNALITLNLQNDFFHGAQPLSDTEPILTKLAQLRKRNLFSLVVHVRSVYSLNHHGFVAANPGFKEHDMCVFLLSKMHIHFPSPASKMHMHFPAPFGSFLSFSFSFGFGFCFTLFFFLWFISSKCQLLNQSTKLAKQISQLFVPVCHKKELCYD